MRRIRTVLAGFSLAVLPLAGLLLAVPVARAQTAPAPTATPARPPAPKPSEAAIKAATALVDTIGVNHQSAQLVAIMRSQMIQLVMRSGHKSVADATIIVDQVLMPDFTAHENEVTNDIIDVWATNFTLDDLKGLSAFYATPLGAKLIRTLPIVTQQSMAAGQAWGQRIYKQAIERHKDDLIARGLKF